LSEEATTKEASVKTPPSEMETLLKEVLKVEGLKKGGLISERDIHN